MKRFTLRGWIIIALVSAVALQSGASAQQPSRPGSEFIAAWEKAGAVFGWMSTTDNDLWSFARRMPAGNCLPAFVLSTVPRGGLGTLPEVDVPFAVMTELAPFDPDASGYPSAPWLELSTDDVKAISGWKRLRALNLNLVLVTDAHLKTLSALSELQHLCFGRTQATEAGFKHLGQLKQLRSFGSWEGLNDTGLKELTGLKQLRFLDVAHTAVSDAGMKELASFKELRRLDLGGTKVGDAGMADVGKLSRLQSLNLYGTRVTDAGLAALTGLKELQALDLSFLKLGSAGLAPLAGFKKLESPGATRQAAITDALGYPDQRRRLQTSHRLEQSARAHAVSNEGQ